MTPKKDVVVVLGGGGARGVAHIGVLKVLKENGIKIDAVVGVSMGAAIGAMYAIGWEPEEIEQEIGSYDKSKAIAKMMDLGRIGTSLLKGKKIRAYLKSILGERTFSSTKIPFIAIGTDLESGAEVVLKQGSLVDAVMASMAVPGIFPPVSIGDRYLIDGGVVNPTPIDIAHEFEPKLVIGVDLVMKRRMKLENPSLVTTLVQAYEIIRTQAVKTKLKHIDQDTVLIKPDLNGTIDSFKFYDINKFIRAGEDTARAMLPEIKKRLK